MFDNDIKIAGNRPSLSIKTNMAVSEANAVLDAEDVKKAEELGIQVAKEFCSASAEYTDAVEDSDENMLIQRHLLLSFTATVGFEDYLKSEAAAGVAQKSFLDYVKENKPELYKYTSDTGAFSFYYLAHRRGNDVERRMGQTFAMLCAHDGDPIYQELGEVLYCWFSAKIKELCVSLN